MRLSEASPEEEGLLHKEVLAVRGEGGEGGGGTGECGS